MPNPTEPAHEEREDHDPLYLSILKSLPGGAVAGWFSSLWLARVKARADSALAIRDLGADLVSEIHVYWSREAREPLLEGTIVRIFQKFSARTRAHVERYGSSGALLHARSKLAKAHARITGAPFGTNSWKRDTSQSVLAEIRLKEVISFVK